MPIIGSFGAGSGKGFGFGGETGPAFIIATGGTVVTCGDYKTHIFTSDGTFSVTNKGKPTGSNSVDYFVVAGGGGGGGSPDLGSGGGGAGGFRVSNSYNLPAPSMSPLASCASTPITTGAYPITVGGGGTGGCQGAPVRYGTSGSNSIFGSITSAGGGAAKGIGAVPACQSLLMVVQVAVELQEIVHLLTYH